MKMQFWSFMAWLIEDEGGSNLLEWGMLVGLIAIVALTAVAMIGPKASHSYEVYHQAQP